MKAATLRSFIVVHTWVGLIAGMALFIAFYAGAITVFHDDLGDWKRRDASSLAEPIGRSQTLLDALRKAHPRASTVFLVLPGVNGPQPSAYWYGAGTDGQHKFVLDPRENLDEVPARGGFVDFIYDLHFTAGLPRSFGTYLFGVVCILYGLALVSGVVLYAPGFFKDMFALRLGRNTKRLWQDAHNVIGILSLPFHVIFAWSGAVLTLGLLLLAPFQYLVYQGKLSQLVERDLYGAPQIAAAHLPKPTLPLRELLPLAQHALPGLEIQSIGFDNLGDVNARATLYGHVEQRRLGSDATVVLNAASGEVVAVNQPRQNTPGKAFLSTLYRLHFADYAHYTLRWLYFALGMLGAFLFYSGNLLWIESRRKRRQLDQPKRTRVMAAFTLGICLGCVAGVSACVVAGALLPDAWASRSYFIVFFAGIAWACVRPPAHAGHELLWLCALLTALIPFADWLGNGEHMFAAFWHGHWPRFFVDAVALLLASAYARMARAVLRRGRDGDPNSVWVLR